MESKNFFSFSSKFASSTIQAHLIDLKIDHLKLIKGDYKWIDLPVIFKQEYGSKLHDILDTGSVSLFLISNRMKTILEENNLTGWKSFPIKLYDKNVNEIAGYYGFSIIGRCGPPSFEKSKIIEKQHVPTGPMLKYYQGIFIDNWGGADFFSPEKKLQIFITKKAADVLRKNKITNLLLEKLSEYEVDVRHVKRDLGISSSN